MLFRNDVDASVIPVRTNDDDDDDDDDDTSCTLLRAVVNAGSVNAKQPTTANATTVKVHPCCLILIYNHLLLCVLYCRTLIHIYIYNGTSIRM